jgi:protein associated with RNAse G/E
MDSIANVLHGMFNKQSSVMWEWNSYFNCSALSQADGIRKVRMSTSLFRVNFDEMQFFPYAVDQVVKTRRVDMNSMKN